MFDKFKIFENNTDLQYIEFQVLELDNGAMYQEAGNELEVCIVVLTGKINVKVDDKWYENLGKRTSVFKKFRQIVSISQQKRRLN